LRQSTALAEVQRRGAPPKVAKETVGAFLERWLADCEPNVRRSTWLTYKGYITNHLVPGLGRIKLTDLSPQQVNSFLTAKASSGLSPQTRHHLRAVLRSALHDAVSWGLLERNAAALARAVKVERRDVVPMTAEEAHAILDAVAGTDVEGVVAVALFAGLRQGEVLGLRWRDVDLDTRTLHVRQILQRLEGVTTFGPPKSKTSRRVVPIAAPLASSLGGHQRREKEKRLRLRLGLPAPDDLMFTTALAEPFEPSGMTHRFQQLQKAAGIRMRTFHDLRHGCATLLLSSGVDIKVISSILGHSSIALTADTYTGVVDSLKRAASDSLGRLFEPAGP
jgi:integrase